jgi:hypothetical protein
MAKSFTNLGATIVDTVADLPTASASLEGLLYYQKDTNELKICDGSRWISMLDTDSPPGLVLMNPTSVSGATNTNGLITFSSSTSININGVFSSTFSAYRIYSWFYTGSSSVNNGTFKLTNAGTANSASYYARMWYYSQGGGGFTTAVSNNASSVDWMFYGGNLGGSVNIDISQPYNSTQTTWMWNSNTWTTADNAMFYGGGFHNVSANYDGFQITTPTAMTGRIQIYGYRDSI